MNNLIIKKTNSVKSKQSNLNKETNLIRRYFIIGERRITNYWWASVVLLGALGFLITGISSYFNTIFPLNSIPNLVFEENSISTFASQFESQEKGFLNPTSNLSPISFFPQGLLMTFYGSLGLLLSVYWWLLIFWNVGGGFNEFNKKDGFIRIFRWGYPGKTRRIDLSYAINEVEAIRVEFKNSGLNTNDRTIYIRFKGKGEIPLTGIGEPLTLKEIEKQASELANFLQVTLEGI